jgi:hypothetical protein
MSPQALAAIEDKLESEGFVSMDKVAFDGFFDSQARKLVNLSGEDALKTIRTGNANGDLAWTELTLLASLMR